MNQSMTVFCVPTSYWSCRSAETRHLNGVWSDISSATKSRKSARGSNARVANLNQGRVREVPRASIALGEIQEVPGQSAAGTTSCYDFRAVQFQAAVKWTLCLHFVTKSATLDQSS